MLTAEQLTFMSENAVHYEASTDPIGTPQKAPANASCPVVSAGHNKHEYTTGYSQSTIWKQFEYNIE